MYNINGIEYNKNYEETEARTREPQDFVIATLDDGTFYVSCQNCNRIKHMLKDPYDGLGKHDTPYYKCPHCGMNLYKNVIKEVTKYCKKLSTVQIKELGFDTSLVTNGDIVRKKRQSKKKYSMTCIQCQKTFKASRSTAKYCSNPCFMKHKKEAEIIAKLKVEY